MSSNLRRHRSSSAFHNFDQQFERGWRMMRIWQALIAIFILIVIGAMVSNGCAVQRMLRTENDPVKQQILLCQAKGGVAITVPDPNGQERLTRCDFPAYPLNRSRRY